MSTEKVKKVTFAQRRKVYTESVEREHRSFVEYLKQIQADAECTNLSAFAAAKKAAADNLSAAKKANKAEAEIKHLTDVKKAAESKYNALKQRAESADVRKRLQEFNEMLEGARFTRDDINPAFLRTWLPNAINSAGEICDCVKVALTDEIEYRERAAAGEIEINDSGLVMYYLRPIKLWSATRLISKFAAAAKARAAAEQAQSQAEREQKRAEKKVLQIAALEQKLARMKAEQERKSADAEQLAKMKAEAEQSAE